MTRKAGRPRAAKRKVQPKPKPNYGSIILHGGSWSPLVADAYRQSILAQLATSPTPYTKIYGPMSAAMNKQEHGG